MGTEIRTFFSLREMSEYLVDQTNQYKALSEDYSQWLGTLLRDSDDAGKLGALQKNMRSTPKKNAEKESASKKAEGKSKRGQDSSWIDVGGVMLCSTEQGQVETVFEAIEEINKKVQSLEKFKTTLQQIERIGLGKNVDYITYIKDDVPEKIVVKNKSNGQSDQSFSYVADFTGQALEH